MFKRWSVAAGVLALAILAFGAFAPATTSAEDGEREGDFFVRGRGELHAEGDGIAAVKGQLDVQVSADRGILLVKDIAGDAEIDVEGEGGTADFHGFRAYFGTGEASITGSHVAVVIVGNNVELDVVGKGWAYLKGQGTFTVNGRGPFRWTHDGRFAAIVSDAAP